MDNEKDYYYIFCFHLTFLKCNSIRLSGLDEKGSKFDCLDFGFVVNGENLDSFCYWIFQSKRAKIEFNFFNCRKGWIGTNSHKLFYSMEISNRFERWIEGTMWFTYFNGEKINWTVCFHVWRKAFCTYVNEPIEMDRLFLLLYIQCSL